MEIVIALLNRRAGNRRGKNMTYAQHGSAFTFVSGLTIGGLFFTALEEWIGNWAALLIYMIGLPAMCLLLYRWMKCPQARDTRTGGLK